MEHKLTFTLGDPSWDGHGLTSVYYIICNHSGQEIEAAYKEMCKKLGFDFLELFDEYECGYMISEEHTTALLENGIIEPDRVIAEETLGDCSYYDEEDLGAMELDGEDEFVDIFFNIVKKELPDFEWKHANLGYETLKVLRGAGYGLFSL